MFPSSLIKQAFAPERTAADRGVRRRRLWDLPAHVHCPVVGVCLPLNTLRRLAARAAPETSGFDDYALHSACVQLARSRNRLAEAVQEELDQRHAVPLKALRRLRDRDALARAWQEAVAQGEIAGPLWAVLTHPQCDNLLSESISQQMHMLQHQAGASLRLDIAHYHALQEENAALARALATAQQRSERCTQERVAAIEALQTRLHQQRADLLARDAELLSLREELEALRALQPDLTARRRLEHQLIYQESRNAQLAQENARLARALELARSTGPLSGPAPVAVAPAAEADVALEGHRILCVGGREASVQVYRKLVEEAGGEFLHHDGGLEDRFGRLETALVAADLVICQTGCISHNAYWRVKDHCKRTGKRCAFVENPSSTGLARGLQRLLADGLADPGDATENGSTGAPRAGHDPS
ncbi:MAG: DUF2325 domain-containing protein [Candidatus Dactylopiibacterium sp.]|nr:DUF2325 domain-containing protein [Candidatus Dactylopiibacterium sp.]